MIKVSLNDVAYDKVIAYMVAEPRAMGSEAVIEFVTEDGSSLWMPYLEEETDYQKIKERFSALRDCFWNGPMRNEKSGTAEIVVFMDDDGKNAQHTRVTEGWNHVYAGFGKHVVIREDYWERFSQAIQGLSEVEIFCSWEEKVQMIVSKDK